jgi:hypothetical protein
VTCRWLYDGDKCVTCRWLYDDALQSYNKALDLLTLSVRGGDAKGVAGGCGAASACCASHFAGPSENEAPHVKHQNEAPHVKHHNDAPHAASIPSQNPAGRAFRRRLIARLEQPPPLPLPSAAAAAGRDTHAQSASEIERRDRESSETEDGGKRSLLLSVLRGSARHRDRGRDRDGDRNKERGSAAAGGCGDTGASSKVREKVMEQRASLFAREDDFFQHTRRECLSEKQRYLSILERKLSLYPSQPRQYPSIHPSIHHYHLVYRQRRVCLDVKSRSSRIAEQVTQVTDAG